MADASAHPKTLGDYFDLQRGASYKSMLLDAPGPVLLGLATIARDGGFRSDSLRTYSGDSPDRMLLRPGDLYVSLKDVTQSGDLLGSVARVPPEVSLGRLTQDTVKLIFRDAKAPREYLYWVMRSPEYRQHCRAHSTGTTNLGLSRDDFLGFPVPELTPVRQRIVDLLEAIEERIEVNRKRARSLEAVARTTFTSWFVNFDPVRRAAAGEPAILPANVAALFPRRFIDSPIGEIPEGWTAGTVGGIADASREGVDPGDIDPNTPYIGLEHMPRRSIAITEWAHAGKVTSGKSVFRRGQILFGKLRPYFHKVGVAPVDGVCSTDIIVAEPKRACWAAIALGHLSSDALVQHADRSSSGTKMPRTNWRDLAAFPIAIPPETLAALASRTLAPMLDRLAIGTHQGLTLSALRDALLPRLISGELRIANAERIVGRAV